MRRRRERVRESKRRRRRQRRQRVGMNGSQYTEHPMGPVQVPMPIADCQLPTAAAPLRLSISLLVGSLSRSAGRHVLQIRVLHASLPDALSCFALSCEPTHAMALHVKNTNKNKHCVHSGLSREMERKSESGRVEKSEIILIEPSSGIELALLG